MDGHAWSGLADAVSAALSMLLLKSCAMCKGQAAAGSSITRTTLESVSRAPAVRRRA